MVGSSDLTAQTPQEVELFARAACLGPPSLIEGEDGAAYNQLHRGITAAVNPKDFLWVRDIADLSWDVLRLRRIKAKLLTSRTAAQVRNYLTALSGALPAQELSAELGDPRVVARVDKLLSGTGRTVESIAINAFVAMGEQLERIDRMLMKAEARRNTALREIERHRSNVAQALRRVGEEVVEAEFEDVRPDQRARHDQCSQAHYQPAK